MNDLLIRALHKEKVERPPIWLMRQAGRYMSEYRAVREKVTFLELCKTPELAYEVTMQPIDILGLDAAIVFSDILVPVEAIGIDLDFNPAPIISNPIRTFDGLNKLKKFAPEEDAPYVYKTIDLLVKSLKVPLIGFSGAPFTLACYMVEGKGSKAFLEIRKLMLQDSKLYHALMTKLTEDTINYLNAQIKHGCACVQMFDTWAGILPPAEYRDLVLPYVEEVAKNIKDAPFIYFAKDSATYFKDMKRLADISNTIALGVDWKIDLAEANELLGGKFCLQGNMDPAILFADKESIRKTALSVLESGKKLPAHIFNLGHGIMPKTPVENVKYLIDLVKGNL